MKICKNCKAELEDNQKFCHSCGSNEFEATENIISDNDGKISVQPENLFEKPQSDLFKSIDGNQVGTVVDNNTVKKAKKKKKLVKIIVPIVAVIVLIVASLGIFSIVNYNNFRPYREMLGKLESGDFIYYQEYDEISKFDFTETDTELNFFEKILNIRKVCEVRLTPHIYFLYDKDEVGENEALYDLIAEEENEEIYNNLPSYCELVIDENSNAKIICDNETLFNINLDNDKNIVSITYNEDKKEYKNGIIDEELHDRFTNILLEYTNYLARDYHASDILHVAQYVSLSSEEDRTFWGIELNINDFVNNCYEDYKIEVEPQRTNESLYEIIISGECSYYDNQWFVNPFYTDNAKVVFCYDEENNECWVEQDNDKAFFFYRHAKQN